MDLTTLRLRLSDHLNDDSTSRWSQTTRDAFINIAYHEICNADNWPFREAIDTSITTVSGTQAYTLPTTINLPLGVWITSIIQPNKMVFVTRKQRDTFNFGAATGRPLYCFRFSTQIQLYPTPDAAYPVFIEYQKKIVDLSAISDEPVFDADFHYLVALNAAAMLKKTSGGTDVDEARDLEDQAARGLADMKARLLPRDLDRKKQVISLYDRGNYNETLQTYY